MRASVALANLKTAVVSANQRAIFEAASELANAVCTAVDARTNLDAITELCEKGHAGGASPALVCLVEQVYQLLPIETVADARGVLDFLIIRSLVLLDGGLESEGVVALEQLFQIPQLPLPVVVDLQGMLGGAYVRRRDRRAIPCLQCALDNANRLGGSSSEVVADANVALARALIDLDKNTAGARPLVDEAIAILQRPEDQFFRALALDVRGRIEQLEGKLRLAFEAYSESARLVLETVGSTHPHYATAISRLAMIALAEGNYRAAEDYAGQGWRVMREAGPTTSYAATAIACQLVQVLQQTGDTAGAHKLLGEIRHRADASANPVVDGHVSLLEARQFKRQGDENRALERYRRAIELLSDDPAAHLAALEMSAILLARGQLTQCREVVSLLLTEVDLERDADLWSSCCYVKARLELASGQYSVAREWAKRGADRLGQTFDGLHPDLANLLRIESIASAEVRNWIDCAAALELAQETEHLHVDSLLCVLSSRRQNALVEHLRASFEITLGLCLSSAESAVHLFPQAMAALLKWKGLATQSAQALMEKALRAGRKSEIVRLREVYASLSTWFLQPNPDDRTKLIKDSSVRRLIEERDQIEADISPRDTTRSTFGLSGLRSVLPEKSLYVDFSLYRRVATGSLTPSMLAEERRFGVFWVTSSGSTGCADVASEAEVAEAVSELRNSIHGGNQDVFTTATMVYNILFGPLALECERAERILVSPDGVLHALPLGVLRDAVERAFVAATEITCVDSGRELFRESPQESDRQPPVIVALPDYSDVPEVELEKGIPDLPDGEQALWIWEEVPGVHDELNALRLCLPTADEWLGKRASKQNLLENLHRPSILHIITHGGYTRGALRGSRDDAMSRSYLALSGANDMRHGIRLGTLTGLEAALVDLHGCHLLVLSACETGLGAAEAGEGTLGLRSGFRMSGVRAQLVSLWRIHGEATALFMTVFYNGLVNGLSTGAALLSAQRAMANQGLPPYFWAGFSLYGQSRVVKTR